MMPTYLTAMACCGMAGIRCPVLVRGHLLACAACPLPAHGVHAAAVIRGLREQGKELFFVTNNSSKSREEYRKKFETVGIEASASEIVSSVRSSLHAPAAVAALAPACLALTHLPLRDWAVVLCRRLSAGSTSRCEEGVCGWRRRACPGG